MNDSVLKTLTVSFVVCLFCSLIVSFAAVSLRDAQNLNKLNDQRIKILIKEILRFYRVATRDLKKENIPIIAILNIRSNGISI